MSIPTAPGLEEEYVRNVYSRLAVYQNHDNVRSGSPRIWPNVKRFLNNAIPGSCVLDIGCGEAKYRPEHCTLFGVDTCAEVLTSAKSDSNIHLVLGDALSLPFRDEAADVVLLISVLHHLSTSQRRRQALAEAFRCLRPGGRILICVWAFEQPNAQFPAQDVLVPWRLHEQTINGRLPAVRFHMNSTKEQRIIGSSVAVQAEGEDSTFCPASWFGNILNRVPFLAKDRANMPPATPRHLPNPKIAILSGIKRWSPMLGRRLTSLLVPVEEQLADEMAEQIMRDAVAETVATFKDVTFYRFYHVFRRGELEQLIESFPGIRVLQSAFEHGNWCLIAEKMDQ